jgi:hypothetical protein
MIQAAKAQQLMEFLGKLPESLAVRLAKAVELDRLAEGVALPHDLIMNGLRPVLRRASGVERMPAPLRQFCLPFQDLLSPAVRKEKQPGRIARSSIHPVWRWVSQSLIPDESAAYCDGVKADVLGFRQDNARLRAREYWPIASAAILTALGAETGRKTARAALGSDLVVADAREMALLLAVGREIVELQNKLPKPTPALSEEGLWMLRTVYDGMVRTVPDAAPFVAVVAMNRLERPWEALRLPLLISRQSQDTLISNTDMGLVGEILLGEIETHAVAIRTARQPQFDADELVDHIAKFATLTNGMVKEVEMRRDGHWGPRLLKDRAALADVMNGYMQRAPREILAALPTLKSGSYAGGPRVPDISRALDAEKYERAIRYGRLVQGCARYAAAASFGASLAKTQDEVVTALLSYSEDILRELRAAEGDRRKHALQYFELTAELTELFLSVEEGEFLRRRGRVTSGAAAAA